MSELDRRTLESLYAHLLAADDRNGQRRSPRNVQLAHTVLHGALKDTQIDGLITSNPADHASPPKRDPSAIEIENELQVWTVDQTARCLTAIEEYRWRALWHLAIGTGARRAELLGLRWTDVELERSTVTFRRSLTVIDRSPRLLGTKTSRGRVVSIALSVVGAIARRQEQQAAHKQAAGTDWHDRWGLVVTHADGRRNLHRDVVSMEFKDLVRTLPLPAIRLHDLRHSHASQL